ncbi:MAG: HNH endonuclease signature motif containing protein [Sedimentisphaerales bacterium]
MSKVSTIEILIAEVEKNLARYKTTYEGLSWRDKVLLLVDVTKGVKELGIKTNPHAASVAARERIKLYLQEYVGIVITASELEVVSGISEYGRRVRELRVQDGYKILTCFSNDPEIGITLKKNEYLLVRCEPDLSAARRWHIANRIRKEEEGGSQGRILKYLLQNVGEIVTTEELAYVAKAREFGRRIRELRTEGGYAIATMFTGRPDLKMGEYVLENAERIAEQHDRKIPFDVQKAVYERDDNRCKNCGWNRSQWRRDDPRMLELHHLEEHAEGGPNIKENLVCLCSRCHDDVHAGRIHLPPGIVR